MSEASEQPCTVCASTNTCHGFLYGHDYPRLWVVAVSVVPISIAAVTLQSY
jgi:hypothetical protein